MARKSATQSPAKKAAVKRAARQVPQLPFDQKLVLQQWVFKLLEAKDIYDLCDEEFRHPDAEVWDTLTRQFEGQLIHTALEITRGRRIEAAQRLGIGRNTITRKIQELGLDAADEG